MARFVPGQSGNPTGRRRGSKNRVNLLLDKMASADAETVLNVVLDKAKDGDLDACALLLGRIWPARKGRPIAIDLPPIATAPDVPAALGVIVAAVSQGDLTCEEAAALASVVEMARRGIEIVEIERYLHVLEERSR